MAGLDGQPAQTKGAKVKKILKGVGLTLGALGLAAVIYVGGMHSQKYWFGGVNEGPQQDPTKNEQTLPGDSTSENENVKVEYEDMSVELNADQKLALAQKLFTGRNASTLEKLNMDTIEVVGTSKDADAQYAYITLAEPTKAGEVNVMYKVAYPLDADLSTIADLAPLTTNGKEGGPVAKQRYASLDHYVAETNYDNAAKVIGEKAEVAGTLDKIYVSANNEMLLDGTIVQGFDYAVISTEEGTKSISTGTMKSAEAVAGTTLSDIATVIVDITTPKEIVDENATENSAENENSAETSDEATNESSEEKTTTTGKFGITVERNR